MSSVASTTAVAEGVVNELLTEQLVQEGLISLREAVPIFGSGRGGKSRHPATLTRDILQGALMPDGSRVRLEAVRVNGAFKTSRAAVLRYIQRQQVIPASGNVSKAGDQPITPARRKREQDRATAELDAALGASN